MTCNCRRCIEERDDHTIVMGFKMPKSMSMMILCPICGNKRCPHANDHLYACTNSNEVGQEGSYYK